MERSGVKEKKKSHVLLKFKNTALQKKLMFFIYSYLNVVYKAHY